MENKRLFRILVVDDNKQARDLLSERLAPFGYEIVTASNGPDALGEIERQPPDLVLLDAMMPGMTGFEVCQRIKGETSTRLIPVIVVTALTELKDRVRGLAAGADDFLTKPFHKHELAARVSNLLKVKELNDQLDDYRHHLEDKVREKTKQVQDALAQLKEAYRETLEALGNAIDIRDEPTSDHCKRVAVVALALATEAGVKEPKLTGIEHGALLHDIGKIGVPDAILRKKQSLTDEEWKIMRQHTEYGRQFVSRVKFLQDAIPIVYCHHEHYDGQGYPQGLKGEEISIEARIFSIVDAYDAMTSDRPYQKAKSQAQALEELKRCAGTQFDPRLVDLFISMYTNSHA